MASILSLVAAAILIYALFIWQMGGDSFQTIVAGSTVGVIGLIVAALGAILQKLGD